MPPWLRALFAGTSEFWLGAGQSIVGLAGMWVVALQHAHTFTEQALHPGTQAAAAACIPCHNPTRLESCSGQSAKRLHPCAAGFDLSIDMVALLVNLIISVLVPSVIGKVGMQAPLSPRQFCSCGSPARGCAWARCTKAAALLSGR